MYNIRFNFKPQHRLAEMIVGCGSSQQRERHLGYQHLVGPSINFGESGCYRVLGGVPVVNARRLVGMCLVWPGWRQH